MPAAADPRVGLVHAPIRAHRRAVLASHLTEQWQEALDPAVDRALVHQDAALGQPLADLRVAQSVADVPMYSQGDDVVGEGTARKRLARASRETTAAAATSEALRTELCRSILR